MFADEYWGEDSPGQEMARQYSLPSPQPFLGSTAKSANTAFVFESQNEIYLWNAVVDTVVKITSPKSKDDIIQHITNGNMEKLQTEQISPTHSS